MAETKYSKYVITELKPKGHASWEPAYRGDEIKSMLYLDDDVVKGAFFGLHLSDEQIAQIIHHAAEGVGVRATARLLGLNKDTVNRVILRAGEHCQLVLSGLLRSLKLKETQLDELWAFVKKRKILTNKS